MKLVAVVALVCLSGCANVDSVQCASAYDAGFRDAIMGLQRQDNLYGPICGRHGLRLDMALYREGWLDGRHEFDRRTPHVD